MKVLKKKGAKLCGIKINKTSPELDHLIDHKKEFTNIKLSQNFTYLLDIFHIIYDNNLY